MIQWESHPHVPQMGEAKHQRQRKSKSKIEYRKIPEIVIIVVVVPAGLVIVWLFLQVSGHHQRQ